MATIVQTHATERIAGRLIRALDLKLVMSEFLRDRTGKAALRKQA